jgi:hypothetical protein
VARSGKSNPSASFSRVARSSPLTSSC